MICKVPSNPYHSMILFYDCIIYLHWENYTKDSKGKCQSRAVHLELYMRHWAVNCGLLTHFGNVTQ